MAIARPGSIVAAISGTIAGTTFTNARAGLVVGQRRRWTDMQTPAALTRRAQLAQLTALWRDLTKNQRSAWNLAGEATGVRNRLGQTVKRSGFRWFVFVNNFGFVKAVAPYPNPPILHASPGVITATLSATAPGTAQLDDVTPELGAGVSLYVSGSASPIGVDARAWRTWRLLTQIVGPFLPNPTFDFSPEWTLNLGAIQSGQQLAVSLIRHEPGFLPSPAFRTTATAT